jgi:protein O-GlcNAc transferase
LTNDNPKARTEALQQTSSTSEVHACQIINRILNSTLGTSSPGLPLDKLDVLELGLGGISRSSCFSTLATSITGVDDSANKIELANQKKTHDLLVCSDILLFLQTTDQKFDLVFAFDSFIYFENLEPVLAGVARVLKDNGRTIFGLANTPQNPEHFNQSNSNRLHFHSVKYVQACLRSNMLSAQVIQRVVPRLENQEPVYHFLTYAMKTASAKDDAATQFQDSAVADERLLYEELVNTTPNSYKAHLYLGNAKLASGEFEAAAISFHKSLDLEQHADAHCNLGSAQAQQGDLNSAYKSFLSALECDAEFSPAHNNAGRAAHAMGDLEAAQRHLKHALSIDGRNPVSHAFLGNIFLAEDDQDQAIKHFMQSIEIDPAQASLQLRVGEFYHRNNQLGKAMKCFVVALQLQPENPEILANIGATNFEQGHISEAGFCFLRALQIQPHNPALQSQFINAMLFEKSISQRKIYEEARDWNLKFGNKSKVLDRFEKRNRDVQRKIKIGVVSTPAQTRLIDCCLVPVFNLHDKKQFEFIHYDGSQRDLLECRHGAEVKEAADLSDQELTAIIAGDEIDILIDLTGHSSQNRLTCFVAQPAPIQINWLGFPGTTGLAKMDHVFTDQFVAPKGNREFYSEQVVEISDCYLCFSPQKELPLATELNTPPTAPCVFGCFANAKHLSTEAISAWAQILIENPKSKLLLINLDFENECVASRITNLFLQHNIAPGRITISAKNESEICQNDFMKVDIALDPFPYADPLNALHFLAVGVPVITLSGDRFSSNTTNSILQNTGLQQFAATNVDQYIGIAKNAAKDSTNGKLTNAEILEHFKNSVVCDTQIFTRNFEKACRNAWEKWCRSTRS